MSNSFKLFIGFLLIVVVGIIVAGFYLVGSPQQARMEKFDQTRIGDFESIENFLNSYYSAIEKNGIQRRSLPQTLQELQVKSPYFYASLNDPETAKPYEYRVLSPASYELCATFSTSNKEKAKGNNYINQEANRWQHDAGRTCFQRQADY